MTDPSQVGMIALAAGVAAAGCGIATGIAEQSIGAAAVGIIAEDQKNFSKALIMTIIPETIAIFGFVVAIILLFVY